MPWIISGIIVSYIIGSIPTAYIFARILKGIDIRQFGSGNVGATNAARLLGKPIGVCILALDILKGFLPVLFLGNFLLLKTAIVSPEALRVIVGLSCIGGHNWTIFLKFKGGKGIATTLGVLMGLATTVSGLKFVLGLTVLTWAVSFALSRIISAASILAGISLPVYTFLFKQSFNQPRVMISLSIILAIFVILRHRTNIRRIFQGKEPHFK